MPRPLSRLLHSSKFWLAMIAMGQTILFQLVPSFPKEVWLSINGVLAIVITMIAVEDAAVKLRMSSEDASAALRMDRRD